MTMLRVSLPRNGPAEQAWRETGSTCSDGLLSEGFPRSPPHVPVLALEPQQRHGKRMRRKPHCQSVLSVQAAHKLKKSVADLCLHISVDGVDADVKFGYEAIRDGWAMLTSDPNIRRRSKGRTMVKLCWVGLARGP